MTEDKLTEEIASAVKDIAAKRETMSKWEMEYSKKRRRSRIVLAVAASAACLALVVAIRLTSGGGQPTPPVFRGGLSYDFALERIDSLIHLGETVQAADSIAAIRQEITEDTLRRFTGDHSKREREAINYERLLVNDVLTRLDELENELKDNE